MKVNRNIFQIKVFATAIYHPWWSQRRNWLCTTREICPHFDPKVPHLLLSKKISQLFSKPAIRKWNIMGSRERRIREKNLQKVACSILQACSLAMGRDKRRVRLLDHWLQLTCPLKIWFRIAMVKARKTESSRMSNMWGFRETKF